jgi:hypothetical protein
VILKEDEDFRYFDENRNFGDYEEGEGDESNYKEEKGEKTDKENNKETKKKKPGCFSK